MKTSLVSMMLLTATWANAQTVIRVGEPVGPISLRLAVEPRVTTGAPYSAEIESDTVQTLGDGNRIVKHTKGRVYRDAAGRVRREEDQPGRLPSATIVDPTAARAYTLDNDSRIVWRSNVQVIPDIEGMVRLAELSRTELEQILRSRAATPAAERADAIKRAVDLIDRQYALVSKREAGVPEYVNATFKSEALPPTTIEGLRAEGRRRTIVIPAGAMGNELPMTIVSEEWTSPDLNILLRTRHSDPRMGESTYRVHSITRAPPVPTLFQVPTGYSLRDAEFRRDQ